MVEYRIIKRLPIGSGAVVGLSAAQAAVRKHRLEDLGEGRYRTKEPMEFKAGETIGLDGELPKAHAGFVVPIGKEEPSSEEPSALMAAGGEGAPAGGAGRRSGRR